VFNNPYKYTDPTGYTASGKDDTNTFRQILAIVVVIVANAIIPGSGMALWQAMLVGAISGTVAGGLQGGVAGALSAGLFYGIGSYFEGAKWAQSAAGDGVFGSGLNAAGYGAKVLTHGIAGGVMARLQGGRFGDGFFSAATAQATAPMIDQIGDGKPSYAAARIAAAAIVGGTVSQATGGKFRNGAMTAAFSHAFNQEAHDGTYSEVLRDTKELNAFINGYMKDNPGMEVPLTEDQLLTAVRSMELAMEISEKNSQFSKMPLLEFGRHMGTKDGLFLNYDDVMFRILSDQDFFRGSHSGADMNYIMQGIGWAIADRSRFTMCAAIEAHNLKQMYTRRHVLYEARQIVQAKKWANFGYVYQKSYGDQR
jgi:hypothetical protein